MADRSMKMGEMEDGGDSWVGTSLGTSLGERYLLIKLKKEVDLSSS